MTGLLAACGETPTRSATQPSVIFHNGPIVTMAGTGTAEALAIAADRVLVAGSTSAVLRLVGPATRLVDLEGRTILPGIVDAHTHLFNDAEQYLGLDLAGAQVLALENGITTLGDLFVTDEFRASMEAFAASGQLKIRTSLYLTHTDNCGGLQGGNWWTAHPPTPVLGNGSGSVALRSSLTVGPAVVRQSARSILAASVRTVLAKCRMSNIQ